VFGCGFVVEARRGSVEAFGGDAAEGTFSLEGVEAFADASFTLALAEVSCCRPPDSFKSRARLICSKISGVNSGGEPSFSYSFA